MIQRYAVLDAAGDLLGFLSDDVVQEIPAGAIPLTDAQWQEWLAHGRARRWENGELVPVDLPPPEAPPAPTQAEILEQIQATQARLEALLAQLPANSA
ncbi:hypothetical protein HMPREF9946_00102 [Acetobacteraceae bacterium AT-5844]|nr:hypothetical protein HMPREF9946_00102 [Acetobacteraceae bacterium AT-5844]